MAFSQFDLEVINDGQFLSRTWQSTGSTNFVGIGVEFDKSKELKGIGLVVYTRVLSMKGIVKPAPIITNTTKKIVIFVLNFIANQLIVLQITLFIFKIKGKQVHTYKFIVKILSDFFPNSPPTTFEAK